MEQILYVLGVALVAHRARSSVVTHVFQQRVGEVGGATTSQRLHHEVYLSVGSDSVHVALHAVACVYVFKNLVVVDEALELVVHNYLEAQVGLLPHQHVHLVTALIGWHLLAEEMFHLGRRHDAVALFVEVHVDYVFVALQHTHFLFAERAEQVFHQSPVEERSVLVDPRNLKISEVAYLCQRYLCCGNEPLLIVEIDEHFHRIAGFGTLGHVATRQQYLALIASVKIQSEVHFFNDSQYVVVAELYHVSLFLIVRNI